MLAEILGMAGDFGPNVAAYWARLKQRPSYAKALAAQEKAMADQNVPAGVTV